LSFGFVGLSAGSHYAEPRVSMDGTELRAPIKPGLPGAPDMQSDATAHNNFRKCQELLAIARSHYCAHNTGVTFG
jgi:hypothetical protein